jgi:Tfp pilus assembly protein PilF
MLGPLFVLGALVAARTSDSERRSRPRTEVAIGAVVLAVLAACTVAQSRVWRGSVALWEHVIAHEPESVTAHYNLGYTHYLQGNLDGARTHFERTLEIDPGYSAASNELGALENERGDVQRAARLFEAAVEADPEVAHYHLNLAMAYEDLGHRELARRHYQRFVERAPPEQAARAAEIRRRLGLR